MSEDKLQSAVTRAARAQALLNDDLLTEAFDIITRGYLDAWAATQPYEQDARERLYTAVKVAGEVKRHLRTAISDGKLAQAEIDRLAAEEQRKKILGIL